MFAPLFVARLFICFKNYERILSSISDISQYLAEFLLNSEGTGQQFRAVFVLYCVLEYP